MLSFEFLDKKETKILSEKNWNTHIIQNLKLQCLVDFGVQVNTKKTCTFVLIRNIKKKFLILFTNF